MTGTVTLAGPSGQRLEIEAEIIGDWAVHRPSNGVDGWVVTHRTSGRAVWRPMDLADARELAERLQREVPAVVLSSDGVVDGPVAAILLRIAAELGRRS